MLDHKKYNKNYGREIFEIFRTSRWDRYLTSRWGRYLGITAPMTQVPVPTATATTPDGTHTGSGVLCAEEN